MKVGSTVGSGKVIRGSGWNAGGAAFCGGVLGAVAVMGHEVYTVFIGRCPSVDPFTYVMAELAVFAPAGAVLLGIAANMRTCLAWRTFQPTGVTTTCPPLAET
jgi:hypothetical protein